MARVVACLDTTKEEGREMSIEGIAILLLDVMILIVATQVYFITKKLKLLEGKR